MKSVANFCIIVLFVLLAACSPAPGVVSIPTLASLPTVTATSTLAPFTATSAPTIPDSPTPADTATDIPLTPTAPPAATITMGPTEAPSITPVPSETPLPSLTPSQTVTPGPSLTPSQTITNTPTATLTATTVPTEDNDAITSLLALAMQATILPSPGAPLVVVSGVPVIGASGGASCAYPAPPGFGDFFAADLTFVSQIGCPVGAPPSATRLSGASQAYEHGVMIYVGDPQRAIYAIFDDGHYRRYSDTWVEGVDPSSGGETPPSGLIEPIRGFGKVWRDNPEVRAGLGWARTPEQGEDLSALQFDRGQVLSPPGFGRVYALADDGTGTGGVWRGT